MSENKNLLELFLGESQCLIVEPSQPFAAAIQSTLQQLGLRLTQAMAVRKFEDARRLIEEIKPKLLICEYEIESRLGLELIELQEKQYEQNLRISIVTTKNSSDSAVAEAADGQVDGYFLKPFSMDTFSNKLTEILGQKLNPSPYLLKINSGKSLLINKEFDKALEEFLSAKPLNPKPTLACFLAGQSYQAKGDLSQALKEYQEGRKLQPLHYKCLTGEFELLVNLKNYKEAYALIDPIRKNYPITSKRLGLMFVAAVFTNHFDDLPVFYELFSKLDQRPSELINISSIALLTAGRYFIKQKNFKKAMEYFEIGLMITGRNFGFLEKITNEFIKMNASAEAEALLAKAKPEELGTQHHALLDFRVGQMTMPKHQMIEKGRKIIMEGIATPDIIETVVKAMAELGKDTLAESTIVKATEKDAEFRSRLYKILADNLPKKIEPEK